MVFLKCLGDARIFMLIDEILANRQRISVLFPLGFENWVIFYFDVPFFVALNQKRVLVKSVSRVAITGLTLGDIEDPM